MPCTMVAPALQKKCLIIKKERLGSAYVIDLSEGVTAATQARGMARRGLAVEAGPTLALVGMTPLGIAMILWLRTEGPVRSIGNGL